MEEDKEDDGTIIFDAGLPDPRKGNEFWKLRSKHGRNKKYTPETLWLSACDYFQWMEDNPLMAKELVKFKGGSTVAEVPKLRAMTLGGFLLFLDINRATWYNYCKDEEKAGICEKIQNIIYTQKLTGAAADLFNANIISREIGLADSHRLGGMDGAPIKVQGINWIGDDEG